MNYSCEICSHSDLQNFAVFDESLALICKNCGTIQQFSKKSLPVYEEKYYSARDGSRFPFVVELAIRFLRRLRSTRIGQKHSPGASFLDIGCGRGLIPEFLQKKGFNGEGTQISEIAVKTARKRGIRIHFGDFRNLDLPKIFQGISLFHVLEHLEHLDSVFRRLADLLEDRGWLIIEIPSLSGIGFRVSGEKWLGLDPEHHRFGFFPPSLIKFVEKYGFALLRQDEISLEHGPFHLGQSIANLAFPKRFQNSFFLLLQGKAKSVSLILAGIFQAPFLFLGFLTFPLCAPFFQLFHCGETVTLWFRKKT